MTLVCELYNIDFFFKYFICSKYSVVSLLFYQLLDSIKGVLIKKYIFDQINEMRLTIIIYSIVKYFQLYILMIINLPFNFKVHITTILDSK